MPTLDIECFVANLFANEPPKEAEKAVVVSTVNSFVASNPSAPPSENRDAAAPAPKDSPPTISEPQQEPEEQTCENEAACPTLPWPGNPSMFPLLMKILNQSPEMQTLKFEQENDMTIDDLIKKIPEGITTTVRSIKRTNAEEVDVNVPIVYIQAKLWKDKYSIHPPLKYGKVAQDRWVKNLLGNVVVFANMILDQPVPSVDTTAIMLFNPSLYTLRREQQEPMLCDAAKFPWPWPRSTPVFRNLGQDLRKHPWKLTFKNQTQWELNLDKFLQSVQLGFANIMQIHVEWKQLRKVEIPNLYLKANSWKQFYVIHPPTNSSHEESECWLRNVLGNIYLFGVNLLHEEPTTSHTACLLFMNNCCKLHIENPATGTLVEGTK